MSHQTHVPESGVQFFAKAEGKVLTFDHQRVSGREILRALGKEDDQCVVLYQKVAGGGSKPVKPDDIVDLGPDGIEKFHTMVKERTDGRGGEIPPPLTEEDVADLNAEGCEWDAFQWQGNLVVRIKARALPLGYTASSADVCFIVPVTYPSAQIDMFNFSPPLVRADGVGIKATSQQVINGTTYQCWSRHRTAKSVWRVGIDGVGTHLAFMDACLRDEPGRQP